jgi:hypothetical protein
MELNDILIHVLEADDSQGRGRRRFLVKEGERRLFSEAARSARRLNALQTSSQLVGVLDRQTYQGGTRGSRLCGEDRDWETENSKVCARTRDTRFIQVRVAKVANPTSCLEIKYDALRLVLVEIRCPARYSALLYIVQRAGS